MLKQGGGASRSVARIVDVCARRAAVVAAVWVVLAAAAGAYVAAHFAMNTDSGDLLSRELPWRQRQMAFDRAFPQRIDLIVVVIDGATPELAGRAAAILASRLALDRTAFKAVWRPDGGDLFERSGLLFLSSAELQQTLEQLVAAQP